MTKPVILVTYWPDHVEGSIFGECGVIIRHTSHADVGYLADIQKNRPSASVWMVPATDPEDPDYERAPALERPARISGAAYWLGQVPVSRHYSVGYSGAFGYVMLSYFSFREGALSIGQSESVPLSELPKVLAVHHANGRTRGGYRYVNGRPVLTDDMHR